MQTKYKYVENEKGEYSGALNYYDLGPSQAKWYGFHLIISLMTRSCSSTLCSRPAKEQDWPARTQVSSLVMLTTLCPKYKKIKRKIRWKNYD